MFLLCKHVRLTCGFNKLTMIIIIIIIMDDVKNWRPTNSSVPYNFTTTVSACGAPSSLNTSDKVNNEIHIRRSMRSSWSLCQLQWCKQDQILKSKTKTTGSVNKGTWRI